MSGADSATRTRLPGARLPAPSLGPALGGAFLHIFPPTPSSPPEFRPVPACWTNHMAQCQHPRPGNSGTFHVVETLVAEAHTSRPPPPQKHACVKSGVLPLPKAVKDAFLRHETSRGSMYLFLFIENKRPQVLVT